MKKITGREGVFSALFFLLLFQNPLTVHVSPWFTYVDEAFGLLGLWLLAVTLWKKRDVTIQKDTLWLILMLGGFVLAGIAGNLHDRFQPLLPVLQDLFTNLKFFMAVLCGYFLAQQLRPSRKQLLRHGKAGILLLFGLLAADVCFGIFPNGGSRYGMTARCLCYGHCTYLAAACVFLLGICLLCYERGLGVFTVMGLLVLVSTLRGKALAGAAIFVILMMLLRRGKPFRLRHLLLAVLVCAVIGFRLIQYYYMDLAGTSARSVLLQNALRIAGESFPIGTGFGTFGSDVAGKFYSPVYVRLGFLKMPELSEGSAYFSDTFWPIVVGQTGVAGTGCYGAALILTARKSLTAGRRKPGGHMAMLFVWCYLMISATSEPAFCNPVATPLAVLMGGWIFAAAEEKERGCAGSERKLGRP